MSRRRRNQPAEPTPEVAELPASEMVESAHPAATLGAEADARQSVIAELALRGAEAMESLKALAEPAAAPSVETLRAEYDRLAAEVTRAKPDAPGYKALREAKRLAFAAWYEASQK